MQQRRLRLGDIVDDYCPRERRVTNHAVVAMIEDDIRQTRCTTCDTEHEYKQGKMPTLRRKKEVSAAYNEVLAAVKAEAPPPATPSPLAPPREVSREEAAEVPSPVLPMPAPEPDPAQDTPEEQPLTAANGGEADETAEGRVHRRLIRATLPRPENHQVGRPMPEFTMRQPIGRAAGKFRGGATRAAGGRQAAGRPGMGGGNSRAPVFGRGAGGRGGGSQSGRPMGHPHRGGQPARSGKKHSK